MRTQQPSERTVGRKWPCGSTWTAIIWSNICVMMCFSTAAPFSAAIDSECSCVRTTAARYSPNALPSLPLSMPNSELEMPAIAAYEVASFYNMYDLDPVGKYKITVCTNLPCALSGGVHAADYVKEKLGIGFNETTADGKFTLKEGECMGRRPG